MKKVKNLVITIIIGALGSALWELGLKQAFVFIYNQCFLYMVRFFSDSFYVRVASRPDSQASSAHDYIMFTLAMLILLPLSYWHRLFHRTPKSRSDAIFLYAFKFALCLIIIVQMFNCSSVDRIARKTLNNIEIVAPYITEAEYKTLKSDFYQLDSKEDYIQLTNDIFNIAWQNDLTLQ